jgi:hypothetical protein
VNAVTASGKDPLPRAIHSGEVSRATDGRLVLLRRGDPCHHRAGDRAAMPGQSVQPVTSHSAALILRRCAAPIPDLCSLFGRLGEIGPVGLAGWRQVCDASLPIYDSLESGWLYRRGRALQRDEAVTGGRRVVVRTPDCLAPAVPVSDIKGPFIPAGGQDRNVGACRWCLKILACQSAQFSPNQAQTCLDEGSRRIRCPKVQGTPDSPCEPVREIVHLCTS